MSELRACCRLLTMLACLVFGPALSEGKAKTSVTETGKLQLRTKKVSKQEGLVNQYVRAICQDSHGFLWVGTIEGLHRYDGYSFLNINTGSPAVRNLQNNAVNALKEDSSGNIWIGTSGGLDVLNYAADTITHFKLNSDQPIANLSVHKTINVGEVRDIEQDSTGRMWFALYGGGINCYDPKTRLFTYYTADSKSLKGLKTNRINGLYLEKNGLLWIATELDGVYKMNVYTEKYPTKIEATKNDVYTTVYKDEKSRYWFGSWGAGLVEYDDVSGKVNYNRFGKDYVENAIRTILEDKQKNLWLGTFRAGLYLFDRETKKYLASKYETDNNQGVSNNTVWTLFEDRSECVWAGTWGNGLFKLNAGTKLFTSERYNDKSGLTSITSILENDQETLWIGTESNGLYLYNMRTRIAKSIKEQGKNEGYQNSIRCIFRDSKGEIWIGSDGGIFKFDKTRQTFSNIIVDRSSISNIYSICEENEKQLWVGSQKDGLFLVNKKEGTCKNFRHQVNGKSSLSSDAIWDIYKDNKGLLWIATNTGLDSYNPIKDEFTHYLDTKSLSCIYTDTTTNDEYLWLGTFDLGLIRFDKTNGKIDYFLQNNEFKHKAINGITSSGNSLWIGVNNGFILFNRINFATELFANSDELLDNGYSLNAFCKTSGSTIYAGGSNGFTFFTPSMAKKSEFIPKIMLTNFLLFNKTVGVNNKVNNRVVLDSTIAVKNHLVLRYDDYIFSLEFSCDDYVNPESIGYAYMLEGLESNWNYTDSKRRFITYTNLKPGDYTLKVKSTNSDGVWVENIRMLHIEVTPPFWNTWWAYILYFATIVLLLILFRRTIQNRERFKNELNLKVKNAEHQQEVEKMKLNFFTNVSHEFRTPLTLIQGPLEKLLDEVKDEKITKQLSIISRNSKRLLNLINQILDFSKIDSGVLHLDLVDDDIILFTEKIFQTFEDEASRKNITYTFNRSIGTFHTFFDPDKYEKILFNLLSNAFKYSPKGGEIELRVEISEQATSENRGTSTHILRLSVIDKGIGIATEKLDLVFQRFFQVEDGKGGTGIGLAFTKELVELYNGKIWVESKIDKGSTFCVEIPLIKSNNNSIRTGSTLNPSIENDIISDIDTNTRFESDDHIADATIVLAEDNADMRNYIVTSLASDFKIIEAENGKEAWINIINTMPDIVISDIMMPEKDGLELCKQIKTNELTSHIPVILLTARSAEDNFVQGLTHGADFYISKPFSPKLLKAQIISLLNNRNILKERFLKKLEINPEEFTSNQLDQDFYFRITNIIEKNIENTELSLDFICHEMAVSRTHLYTKIKAISGQSGSDFIKIIRLKHAAILIKDGHRVSKVFAMVGFKTQPHFTRSFKEHFGVSPTDFMKKEG